MNADSSIAAAGFRSRSWKQRLRELQTALDRQYDAWLAELAKRTNANPTFNFEFVRHEHESGNE